MPLTRPDYTAVPRALTTAAPRTPKGIGIGLQARRASSWRAPKTAKRDCRPWAMRISPAVHTAGSRGDSLLKLAQSAVSLGEK